MTDRAIRTRGWTRSHTKDWIPSNIVPAPVLRFVSRPDLLPPRVTVRKTAQDTAPGYIFVNPKVDLMTIPPTLEQGGPAILGDDGQPVWFLPRGDGSVIRTAGLRPQTYQGKPVLTWWEGQTDATASAIYGTWVVMDESYRIIARIDPADGLPVADYHDLVITSQDTALFLVYRPERRVVDGVPRIIVGELIQEVEIATGRLVFQWDSLDHINPAESFVDPPESPQTPYHYLHLNSLSLDSDGNIVAGARHTSTVYSIDRGTGRIIWRLGGKESDFALAEGAAFSYQHDAQLRPDGTLSLFDNASTDTAIDSVQVSRGLVLALDTEKMTASVSQSFPSPDGLLSGGQGSVQELPNGDIFVGWGTNSRFTEFAPDGQVLYDASFTRSKVTSYRAYRFAWTGRPVDAPAVAVTGSADAMDVYASWNGATEVGAWRVLAGSGPNRLAPVAQAPRHGFETAIPVAERTAYVAVQALDGDGHVLGTSDAVPVY